MKVGRTFSGICCATIVARSIHRGQKLAAARIITRLSGGRYFLMIRLHHQVFYYRSCHNRSRQMLPSGAGVLGADRRSHSEGAGIQTAVSCHKEDLFCSSNQQFLLNHCSNCNNFRPVHAGAYIVQCGSNVLFLARYVAR